MPSKLLKRPAGPVCAKPQTKSKQKGKGKTKTAVEAPKTVQDLVLSQAQSFELVKIGVNAAISQFVFCRELFPSNVYRTRIYDASDPALTYETFINGTNIPKNFNLNKAGDEIISFNSIVRGTGNPGVEKLLDWLEFGVGNAVNDKCLAKFQLSIYRKEVVPEQLVEAFTINFTYRDTGGNRHVQLSTSISDKTGKVINLGFAQDGLRELILQIMNSSRNIRGESTGRKVSMQLLYNENARPKQEYRGFRAVSSTQLLPDSCGILMGKMNNGLNGLAMTYYNAPAIGVNVTPIQSRFTIGKNLKPTAPKAIIDDNTQSSLIHSQISQSGGSQQSTMQWVNEIGHRRKLDEMDTQSHQPTFGKHSTFHEPEELDVKGIENELEEGEEEVRCECTNFDDRENLVQCRNCRNFCHSQCYGYNKEEVGAKFECYECLLAESEPDILFEKMYPLCTRRRMVYYLEQYGFNDMEGLCQYMYLNYEETEAMVEALSIEGIIKKCPKSSKEPFRFVDLDKLRSELFDPSKYIAHTKVFATANPEVDLSGKSQDQTHLTPVAGRFHQPNGSTRGGLQSEGSSTQTPSSWRSLHNKTLRISSRVPAHSTPQQSNKRAGDEILENSSKKRRAALVSTSPFSLRSNSSH